MRSLLAIGDASDRFKGGTEEEGRQLPPEQMCLKTKSEDTSVLQKVRFQEDLQLKLFDFWLENVS